MIEQFLELFYAIITFGPHNTAFERRWVLMWKDLFLSIVAPTLVGIVLALFSKWLNGKDDD